MIQSLFKSGFKNKSESRKIIFIIMIGYLILVFALKFYLVTRDYRYIYYGFDTSR